MPGWNPWVVLCVSEDASYQEVQRSFRRMVKQTHPDGGGDARAFATVVRAFEDVRRSLAREHGRAPVPSTPYDSWLVPAGSGPSWVDDGGLGSFSSVAMGDGASAPDGHLETNDFTALLHQEMAKVRPLALV